MKTSIIRSLALLLFAAITLTAAARNNESCDDRIVSRLASSMNLNDVDRAKFEAAYRRYQAEMQDSVARYPRCRIDRSSSDSSIDSALVNQFAQQQALLDLRKKYYTVWKEFLTPGQIAGMYENERSMRSRMTAERSRRNVSAKVLMPSDVRQRITEYVTLHFPENTIASYSRNHKHSDSEVTLDNGIMLLFKSNGNIKAIIARKGSLLPETVVRSVIPAKALRAFDKLATQSRKITFKRGKATIEVEGTAFESVTVNADGTVTAR